MIAYKASYETGSKHAQQPKDTLQQLEHSYGYETAIQFIHEKKIY
jgi:hypothetical protein